MFTLKDVLLFNIRLWAPDFYHMIADEGAAEQIIIHKNWQHISHM